MTKKKWSDRLLWHAEGGSLNTIEFRDKSVVKSYTGEHVRGSEKLRQEHSWLRELPASVRRYFPRPLQYVEHGEPPQAELHLSRHEHLAIAKAILLDRLSHQRAADTVDTSLRTMLAEVYPLRTGTLSGIELYETYHAPRLLRAIAALGHVPDVAEIVAASAIYVNGSECPPFAALSEWLDVHAQRYFPDQARMVAGHGDLHLDNILASATGPVELIFVDPRGDLLVPPHYDFAKMHKALTGYYDVIHYGRYEISVWSQAGAMHVNIEPDRAHDAHYEHALEALLNTLPEYADAEEVSVDTFRRSVALARLAHFISFAWYHANHPQGCNVDRVSAFLAMSALMARDLMLVGPDRAPNLERRLLTPN